MNHKAEIKLSIGVFAHNEANNIGEAIKSVQASVLNKVQIEQIIIISSGSLDDTNQIAASLMKQDSRIRLITQDKKEGKALAINIFISKAKSPILVTMSADLKLHPQAIEAIGMPFLDRSVGMAGARPVPLPIRGGKINPEIALLWQLHHEVCLIKPKCGELVAFRNVIRQIPVSSAVDEANIEVLLTLLGYRVVYTPQAVVYNRGPKNLAEFIKQRRRVQAGHQWVMNKYNYKVATMEPGKLVKVVGRHLWEKPQDTAVLARLLFMEAAARTVGNLDYYVLGRNPYNWQMIPR